MFGESGRLKGLPETINVPETMLENVHNVRSACNRLLQGYHLATFAQMAKVVVAQSENLQELDRLWVLEENFLVHHARPLGQEKVRQQLLDALPDESTASTASIEGSIRSVAALRGSPLVLACGSTTEDEVDSLYKLLGALQQKHSPAPQAVLKMSKSSRELLDRCEHFLTTLVFLNPEDVFSEVKMLSGRSAMQHLWSKFESKSAADRHLNDAPAFRQFAWMLTVQQNSLVDALVTSGIASYQAEFLKASICDVPAPTKAGTGSKESSSFFKASGSGSSSSSSSALAKAFVTCASTATVSKPADTLACSKAKLLEMFRK